MRRIGGHSAPGQVVSEQGELASGSKLCDPDRILSRQRLDPVPAYEREHRVLWVDLRLRQRLAQRPAILEGNPLQNGGEAQQNSRRGVRAGQRDEPGQRLRRRSASVREQADRPSADRLISVVEQPDQRPVIQGPGCMERPQGAKPASHVGMRLEDRLQVLVSRAQVGPLRGPLLEQSPRRSHVPVVLVKLEPGQFLVGRGSQVDLNRLDLAEAEFVDPPVLAVRVVGIGLMAFAPVRPVGEVDRAIGTVFQLEAAEPGVVDREEIALVVSDVARSLAFEPVVVGAMAVDIEREQAVPEPFGPVISQVDHGADMGMTPAGRAVLFVPLALARVGPVSSGPVKVVSAGLEQAVEVGIVVLAEHPLVMRAGDDMEQMRDHAVGDERLAMVVKIQAPGVGGSMGHGLEDLPGGVIAPDAAVDRHASVVGSARLADPRVRHDAVAAPEPSVRRPFQGIEHVVLGLGVPAVQHHNGRAVGPVVPVPIGNEEEVGSRTDPDAAEAQLDSREIRSLVVENRAAIESAVAIGILEDQDPVLPSQGGVFWNRSRGLIGGRSEIRSDL